MLYALKKLSIFIYLSAVIAAEKDSLSSEEANASAMAQAETLAQNLQSKAWKLIEKGNLLGSKKGCVRSSANNLPKSNCSEGLISDPSLEKSLEKPSDPTNSPLLIFVSFSMPEVSLKTLGESAQSHKAVLVMRGLHEDDFSKTAQKIEKLGIVVDINPELFEIHRVTSVPTFVKLRGEQAVSSLKGNVTLEFASKKLGEKSEEKLEVLP